MSALMNIWMTLYFLIVIPGGQSDSTKKLLIAVVGAFLGLFICSLLVMYRIFFWQGMNFKANFISFYMVWRILTIMCHQIPCLLYGKPAFPIRVLTSSFAVRIRLPDHPLPRPHLNDPLLESGMLYAISLKWNEFILRVMIWIYNWHCQFLITCNYIM